MKSVSDGKVEGEFSRYDAIEFTMQFVRQMDDIISLQHLNVIEFCSQISWSIFLIEKVSTNIFQFKSKVYSIFFNISRYIFI